VSFAAIDLIFLQPHSDPAPNGFKADHQRTFVGVGEAAYEASKEAIRRWAMFPGEMTTLYWPDQRIQVGADVAVLFRAGPLWSLNPCRIVYVIDDASPNACVHRFGFAYGTLAGHLECGEERFSVSWNRDDDSVHYELFAVSRPNHLLTRIGYPYARFVQARFRRLSARSMIRAVHAVCPLGCQ
jgi:uncharacterized protein (UPF0548 family)